VLKSPGFFADATAALILGWLLVAAALGIRRRRFDVTAGVATALLLCLAVYATASATPTKKMLAETLGYTLWSASTIGMFTWLIALWAAVVLSGADDFLTAAVRARARPGPSVALPMLARALAGVAALALAGLAGGVGAAAGTADEHKFEFAALANINSHLGAVPRGHNVYLNARLDGLITPLRPEMTYDLRRRGVRALGVGAYYRTGHWYERREHPYDYIVWVYDNRRLPVPGARVIAVAHITTNGRPHTIEVALSHVQPRARAARAASAAGPGAWSVPRVLSRCASVPPAVAFPSAAPSLASGRGAVLWVNDPSACGAPRASGSTLTVAALSAGERARALNAGGALPFAPATLQVVGGSHGRITALAGAQGARRFVLLQGHAGGRGRMAPVLSGQSPAPALARAYLGDVALATVTPAPAIDVRVQRYFKGSFAPMPPIAIHASPVSALTATMDYRADVLVAWQQDGAVYAHMLRASGRADPTQRLGPSGPNPQLRAVVSDDDHGMIAWSSTTQAGGQPQTTTYVDLSGPEVRFKRARRLASFADPSGAGQSPGSVQLVRLSSENVLLAWTTREGGQYLVRAAPAVYAGARPSAVLSDARSAQSVLADLAAGPAGEAIALWRASRGAAFDARAAELWSARAYLAHHDRPGAGPALLLSGAGASATPSVAVDPANDHAVAAWLAGGAVQYASAAGSPGYHPHPASLPRRHAGTHWLRIALAVLAVVALLAAAAALAARRRARVLR
jgi:hypothetical protein